MRIYDDYYAVLVRAMFPLSLYASNVYQDGQVDEQSHDRVHQLAIQRTKHEMQIITTTLRQQLLVLGQFSTSLKNSGRGNICHPAVSTLNHGMVTVRRRLERFYTLLEKCDETAKRV